MVYPIPKITLLPFTKLWIKEIKGMENLPKPPFIIAANHSSYMDHFVLCNIVVPRYNQKLHFLAKKEHFDKFFERMWHIYAGAIPLDRQAGGKKALKWAISALKHGKIIGIYPEGTRTLDGKIQKGKTGIARLSLAAKVPIVPIGIMGNFEILPKGRHIPRMKKSQVSIGKPIYFDKYYNKRETKALLRSMTTQIMKEIARLSRQRYGP
jgi:1-acyl-sn-glycerol-3-phosphate acyltransferase